VALVQRLLAAGSAQAVDTNRHPHGFDALSGHRTTGSDRSVRASCTMPTGTGSAGTVMGSPLHDACRKAARS
jgi:hypothetical protein